MKPEGIPDGGGKLRHGVLGQIDSHDLLGNPFVFRQRILQTLSLCLIVGQQFQLFLQFPLVFLLFFNDFVAVGLCLL